MIVNRPTVRPRDGGPLVVFGGTFDPPHVGHVVVARNALRRLEPVQLRVVPAGDPWMRADELVSSASLRMAWAAAAFADLPRVVIDPSELARAAQGVPSSTVETVERVRSEVGPHLPLWVLVGADVLEGMHRWHRIEELSGMARLLIATRHGASTVIPATVPQALASQADWVAGGPAVSSTEIRTLRATGDSRWRALVPPRVAELLDAMSPDQEAFA